MQCPKCKSEIHDNATVCEYCGHVMAPEDGMTMINGVPVNEKQEDFVLGLVGALLGSLLGAACIVLLDQFNLVASLSGVVLALATLKGYELLGHKLSKKGVVACIILMIVIPYVANQFSLAITFMNYAKECHDYVTFGQAFTAVPALLSEAGFETDVMVYSLESGSYYSGLAMIYLFTVLGAFSTVRSALSKHD